MELFRLLGTIAVNNSEANESIDETTDKAEKSESKMSSAFSKIGSAALKVGKVVGAGFAAITTGIVAITKKSVEAYADFEQLTGGVETLFGSQYKSVEEYAEGVGISLENAQQSWEEYQKRQNTVLNNAKNAYKTAGLSANEYMETVTSFAASLNASLGENAWQSAKYADMAITDMSDNANKMGTSMESIQNAYQGFSKQNYTMLDNLKLGYGGTKEEMERLLSDATKLSGVEYDISSFADITAAIHVIQDELGITGTTAKEAEETISGSIAMVKSSWQNVLAGLASGDGDLDDYLDSLFESVHTCAKNIIPTATWAIKSMMYSIKERGPDFINLIVEMAGELLPVLVETATTLVVQLVQNLPNILTKLSEGLFQVLQIMFSTVGSMLPESVTSNFSLISDGFQLIWDMCQTYWDSIGKPIFDTIMNIVQITREWFTSNFGSIDAIAQECFLGINQFWEEHLKPCFEAIGNFIQNVLAPAFEIVFKNFILPIVGEVFCAIGEFWNGTLKPVFTGIIDFLTGVFSGDWEKAFNGIISVAEGLLNGIEMIFKKPFELAKSIVEKAIDTIKGFFDFEWNLPKIKLPHFSIDGEFSLNPPSIPSFGIDWYAKAMDNPMVMTKPTAFGINSFGQIMAGGEKGSEVVSGTDTLMNMISSAVSEQNCGLISVLMKILEAILSMDENMGGNLREAIAGTSLQVNNREFARLVKAVN